MNFSSSSASCCHIFVAKALHWNQVSRKQWNHLSVAGIWIHPNVPHCLIHIYAAKGHRIERKISWYSLLEFISAYDLRSLKASRKVFVLRGVWIVVAQPLFKYLVMLNSMGVPSKV